MCNSATRNYFGFQATYPWGAKEIIKITDVEKLVVRVTIENSTITGACDDPAIPICEENRCPPDYAGREYPWLTLLIGVPLYDRTYQRQLWVEISPYWTPLADYTSSEDAYLFYGANPNEQLERVTVEHPQLRLPKVPLGSRVDYYFDVLPLIKALPWGRGYDVDWNNVIFTTAYVGTEEWGWARSHIKVSNLDLLYQKKFVDPTSTSTPTPTPTPTNTPRPTATNTLTPTPDIPGDANGDGRIDGIDYVVWLNHYNPSTQQDGEESIGDFNDDGKVDGLDYVIWLNNYTG
jgi:hypothetical protein